MLASSNTLHAVDADRIDIHTLAAWEAPHVAAPATPSASFQTKTGTTLVAKTAPTSSCLDTGPTVSAMVQSLARALPASSRVVQPSTQPSRPMRAPTTTPQRPTLTPVEAARVALPPLPPTQRPALPPTQAVRDAHPPLPPAQPPTQAVRHAPPPPPPTQRPASAPRPTQSATNAATAVPPPEQQVSPLPALVARAAPLLSPSLPYAK